MHRDPEPLSQDFRDAVNAEIERFLVSQEPLVQAVGTRELMTVARTYALGGKRLRPAFCVWAYRAAGGEAHEEPALLRAASSLDLLQASALVHDDLIDHADTRRGHASAHRFYEELHRARAGRGDAEAFGAASAVLLGDMLLMWSVEMFDTCGHRHFDAARQDLSMMRMEVTAGQFLDVSAAFGVADDPDALEVAKTVLLYKSASYSMRRPALVGARLAHCDEETYQALGIFGAHIGSAFQLRDDVLGVWGKQQITGKPEGGDLREGKATVLVLTALQRASESDRALLESVLGNAAASAEDIASAARVLEDTGSRDVVERLIEDHLAESLSVLDQAPLTDEGRAGLRRLAELSVRRAY